MLVYQRVKYIICEWVQTEKNIGWFEETSGIPAHLDMDIQIRSDEISPIIYVPSMYWESVGQVYYPCNSHCHFVALQRDAHIENLNRVLSKSNTFDSESTDFHQKTINEYK
jgi:hypothetical protein